MFSALIAAIINPIELIGTKIVFKSERVNYKAFLVLNMFFILIFSTIANFFWGGVTLEKLTPLVIMIFALLIIVAFFFNFLFYYAISGDEISSVEPIGMLVPITSVAFAAIIYPSERNWPIFIITIIASLALAVSRIEKHHLKFNKYMFAMAGFVILISFESILAKYLLGVFSPVTFYTIRIGFVAILLSLFLHPNLKVFGKKRTLSVGLVSLFITIEVIMWYSAIRQIGIVKTSLIFLLGPVLTLFASKFYLKEKFTPKTIAADSIIVLSIIASILIS